jgi:sarcosine oxidase delta subunit
MSTNIIHNALSLNTSKLCQYDTTAAFETDFSRNGDVDGWDYYRNIHTYGCWGGFVFGTFISTEATIGRTTTFTPIPAKDYYIVKVVMKYDQVERRGTQLEATTGKLAWRTLTNPVWGTDKEQEFTITPDGKWHEYVVNMGETQWWQGDVYDLRLQPSIDGRAGDTFFVKGIKILATSSFRCTQVGCSSYSEYTHYCPGVGVRGSAEGSPSSIRDDNVYKNPDGVYYYTIENEVNDVLLVNINDYGYERVRLDLVESKDGTYLARLIGKAISRLDIGGYAEAEVAFENDKFIIYSGTYHDTSTVKVGYSAAAVTLGFYDTYGNNTTTEVTGTTPATLFKPASSFKIKTSQILDLFDADENTNFKFDPFGYSTEGGRSDWLNSGVGGVEVTELAHENTNANTTTRSYNILDNAGKTIIDYNHPFNTSGRIKYFKVACTLDNGVESGSSYQDQNRVELTGAQVIVFRPKRDGTLTPIAYVDIPNRDRSGNQIYSAHQDSIEIECDIWVNKGDLIGVYNANIYVGKSFTGSEIDATYYQVTGKPTVNFNPGRLEGEGTSGLQLYGRGDLRQDRLIIDIDLGVRYNLADIILDADTEQTTMDYNIARCVDIDWTVNLYGHTHKTGYKDGRDGTWAVTEHPNTYYGLEKLTDGVYSAPDGKAGTLAGSNASGLVIADPAYFFVNGDGEWVSAYQYGGAWWQGSPFVSDFQDDPVSFTIIFPHNTTQTITKSKVYFKEKWNFRNFGLSTYNGPYGEAGDAEVAQFSYIPEFTAIILDNRRYEKDGEGYDTMKDYLFNNPCQGKPIFTPTGPLQRSWDVATGASYYQPGEITNITEALSATNADWNVLEHEFEPINCYGFMFYCTYHESTKINEMELYCASQEVGSSLIGGTSISYSLYGDVWWSADMSENDDLSVRGLVNDTPRYLSIEINPVSTVRLKDIDLQLSEGDLYLGDKGCDSIIELRDCTSGETNDTQIVEIENKYGTPYDLYVDIQRDGIKDEGLLFYSSLSGVEAVVNPELGPDCHYKKEDDYVLRNADGNVAINCECYGLEDLLSNKKVWVTDDDGYSWYEWGTITKGREISFSNMSSRVYTVLEFPALSRNKYWKLKFKCKDHSTNVREVRVYYGDEELEVVNFYHDKSNAEAAPMTDTAPHLDNYSVRGSYYTMNSNNFIGFELAGQLKVTKIVMFHDDLPDYSTSFYQFGIDHYAMLCIQTDYYADNFFDYSYNELSISRSNVVPQRDYYQGRTWSYQQDFATCSGHDWTIWDPYASSYDYFFGAECVTASGGNYMQTTWNGTNIQPMYGGYHGAAYKSIDEMYEDWQFKLDFKVRVTSRAGNVSLGLLRTHYWSNVNWARQHLWGGVQASFNSNGAIELAVHDDTNQYSVAEYDSVSTSNYAYNLDTTYYLRLQSDGVGNYKMYLWTGDWDTGTLVSSLSLYSNRRWRANKLGIGGGSGGTPSIFRVYSAELYDAHTYLKKGRIGDAAPEFAGSSDSYLSVTDVDKLAFSNKCFNFDFHINFYSLPADGESVVIAKQWPGDTYATEGATENAKKSWAFLYVNNGGTYRFEFHVCYNTGSYNRLWTWNYTLQTNRYYHIALSRGPIGVDWRYMQMNIDRFNVSTFGGGASYGYNINVTDAPITIGQGLDGLLDNMRISVDSNDDYAGRIYWNSWTDLPAFETEEYERMYTYQLYVSDNNLNFGHYADVDALYDNSFSYHTSNGVYSSQYYTYFAIDLEQRHKLGLLRTFGDTSYRHNVSLTSNTLYSNVETTNPYDIVMDSTYEDARWVVVTLLNGNGTTYTIRNLGLYPDITESIAPGGDKYNCVWTSFGKSITTFDAATNLALGKTVTASSQYGNMFVENIVNGDLETNLADVWGSDEDSTQWVEVDLEEDKQLYRFVIYHGSDGSSSNYMVHNYTIEYKADGDTDYTTAFTITNNSSQSRTHDLSSPITARYVRMYITSYSSLRTAVPIGTTTSFFRGATLREIEIYEYYGFTTVNSQEYPMITINLQDQFQMTGHSVVGIDAEDSSTDWSNSSSEFTYANSVRNNPHKVYFEPWGSNVGFGQWVAIRRNTATDLSSGPDILKGITITAEDPRPSEHAWWWGV